MVTTIEKMFYIPLCSHVFNLKQRFTSLFNSFSTAIKLQRYLQSNSVYPFLFLFKCLLNFLKNLKDTQSHPMALQPLLSDRFLMSSKIHPADRATLFTTNSRVALIYQLKQKQTISVLIGDTSTSNAMLTKVWQFIYMPF